MKEIEIRETVLFYDTDCGGVVSNIAYLRYVEKARAALFTILGMDLLSMTETGLFPVVIRTEIDYRLPARLGQEVTVTARLAAVDKVRATCDFLLTLAGSDGTTKTVAEARQIVALVQMPEGRPKRIPSEWFIFIE
jgi:YbgC/YbaW family acyl-CoA thioester hydrolase